MTKVAFPKEHKKSPTLYTKAVFVGYQRSFANQRAQRALLKLEGVQDTKASEHYLGKHVVYVYKVKGNKGPNFRAIWGKITRSHGTNGAVRAKFSTNLPGQAMGKLVRVMLYPSHV